MERFISNYPENEFVSIAACFWATLTFSTCITVATTVLYWKLGYFSRWNDNARFSCSIRLNMFLILRVVGGLGMFPWWEWKSSKGDTDNTIVCVAQALSQDIGAFGSFLELLFMSCILFLSQHDIFGLTLDDINTKHHINRITALICIISAICAFILLHLRNWCINGPIKKLVLDIIHFLFYGIAWLIAGWMIFPATWLYLEEIINSYRNFNLQHDNVDISDINSNSNINNNIADVNHVDNNGNRCKTASVSIVSKKDCGKTIALNIFLLSGCIFISTITHVIASVRFFINGPDTAEPSFWSAILAAIFLQSYPAMISVIMIFGCRKTWWKFVEPKCHKLMKYWDNLCNKCIWGCHCIRKKRNNYPNESNESTDVRANSQGVSVSTKADLEYNIKPILEDGSSINSRDESLFGPNNGSLVVHDRNSIDMIENSCATVSQNHVQPK